MRLAHLMRRAMPLGLAAGVTACDLAGLLTDPAPQVEQTWNLPADSVVISVASLLPPDVSIYSTPGSNPPDSSAFEMALTLPGFSRRLGDDCAQCDALNGQTTMKPAFVLSVADTTSLPPDVAGGTIAGGQIAVQVTNGLSFDPLRVNTGPNPQGYMVLVLRSGGVVIGRDSVNGATTPFAPGSVLARPITLLAGQVTGDIVVDLTLNSPQGDQAVTMNSNGTLSATANVTSFRMSQIAVNVGNRSLTSPGTDTIPLDDLGDFADNIVSATLLMSISNPFAVTGTVDVRLGYGPGAGDAIVKTLALPTGTDQLRSISLTQAEMQTLFGKRVGITMAGAVSSAGPIVVTPKQVVRIGNRLVTRIRTGSGN